jgi:hypothetical protein
MLRLPRVGQVMSMSAKIHRVWLTLGWLVLLALPVAARAEPPPVIERVEPSRGPPGTLLRITGRRLRGETHVRIGETPLSIELNTPNLVTARVHEGVASGPVRIATAHGQVQGPDFTVTQPPAAPSVARIQPLRAAVGASVTIHGQHFSLRLAQNVVLFGSAPAIVESATPTQLQVIVPEAASSGAVTVQVLGAGQAHSAVAFEVVHRVRISEVLPSMAAAGDKLELHGLGFDPQPRANRVYLGETPLRVLEAAPARLLVSLGQNARSGRLRVEVAGAGVATAPADFEVLSAPVLSAFAPRAGALPTEISVSGSGFGRDAAAIVARLGETPLRVSRVAPTELVLEIPAGAPSGKISVELAPRGKALSSAEFTVTDPLDVQTARPLSGPVGSEVVIDGAGFAPSPGDNRVLFAGVAADVLKTSPTRLSLRVPAAAKSGPISVQVGASRAETHAAFVVTNPPRIARVSVEHVPAGRELTLFGAGFGQSAALVRVTLDGQPLELVAVHDDAIVVRAPSAAVSGELTVYVTLQGRASYSRPIRVVEAR